MGHPIDIDSNVNIKSESKGNRHRQECPRYTININIDI